MASGERCHETSAHRFTLVRAAARIQRDCDLPRARCSRFRVGTAMRPTDFCHPLHSLLCTRAHGSRPALPIPERTVRSEDPSFHDALDPLRRAVRRRGGVLALTRGRSCFWAADPDTLSRSTHDFASDVSSPPGSRLRLRRSVCVVPVGSRPLPLSLVKGTACHDPRRLPSVRHPSSLGAAPRACLATIARVIHPLLAPRFACAREKQKVFDTEVCNLKYDARARTDFRARCPSPAPDRRPVRVERLCPCGRPTRESHVDLRRHTGRALRHAVNHLFTRSLAFRGRAGSCFEPVSPLPGGERRRLSPERCVRRRSPPLFHLAPLGSAFFTRVADRPAMTSRRATWAEACETKDPCAPTPQGSGTPRVPLLAGKAPCTLCHRPGCMRGWSCRTCLGNANPERPRSSFLPPPAKEEAAPKTRVLGTAP
jgi:hypothetical protein